MDLSEELAYEIETGIRLGRFNLACIEKLLHLGADPNGSLWGESYLHALADSDVSGSEIVTRLLISFGADAFSIDHLGAEALSRATRAGNLCMAKELLRFGADPTARSSLGYDAMVFALERVDDEMAHVLLDAGYPARQAKDQHGLPALICIADHPKAQRLAFELIFKGADPNEASSDGWTPLTMACRSGNAPMVSLLISEGADIHQPGPAHLSALSIALGARPGKQNSGTSRVGPGHIASALRIAREDSFWGARSDAIGLPPLLRLYQSCARFESEWFDALLLQGADPKATGSEGQTLLHLAARCGAESSSLLLAHWALRLGVDPGVKDFFNRLPEENAAQRHFFQLELLLRSHRESGSLSSEILCGSHLATKRL